MKLRTDGRSVIRVAWAAGFALALAGLGACTTNPATGRKQFTAAMPLSAQVQAGQQYQPQLTQEYGGEIPQASVRDYVSAIGQDLASRTEGEFPGLPWEFTVLDSDVINAFALPGGKVFISRGLAANLSNEAQLASILGHEIGHVTGQHVVDSTTREMIKAAGIAGVGLIAQGSDSQWVDVAGQALIGAGGVYALTFDRAQESESDALGIRYMARAGYNPIGSLQAMQVLADLAGSSPGGIQDWFSTHPHPATRVGRIRDILQREFPEALANPEENVFAERYRERLLAPLGVAMAEGAGAPIAATVMPEGRSRRGVRSVPRLGVMNLPGMAHEAGTHEALWCSLCTRERDGEIRARIEAVE